MLAIGRSPGLKRLVWLPLLLAGCAGHLEQIQPAEPSRRIALRRTCQRPVELPEEAFREGMLAITGGVQASQWSALPPLRIHLAAASEAELARTRRYLEWCQQSGQGGGDCAGVLDGGVFREDARASFALHVALSGAIREAGRTLGSIKPEQVRAALSLEMLMSAGLMASPDPVSKLLAIGLACNLIAYLGVDLFNHVVLGYVEMRKAAQATQRFDDLVDIGRWYAGVLGPSIARVAVMLATLGVAKIASLLPMSATGLPGAAAAAANTEAAGLPLGQVGAVEGVAVAGDGTVAVTVAGTVAMSGASDPTKPATHAPVPAKATEVLAHIRNHRSPPPGTRGGSAFDNDGRNGSQILPKTDSHGNPIQYREWDVNPSRTGASRDLERIVTGSDGRAYYTADHYETFTEMP